MEHTPKPETKSAHAVSLGKPIVRVIEKKKKDDVKIRGGKKTTSKGVGRFDDVDDRVSKMAHRVTRALDSGVESYIDHRNKSANERKDGAYVDMGENVGKGLSKAVSEGAPIIGDMAEMLNSRPVRRQMRNLARTLGRIPIIN